MRAIHNTVCQLAGAIALGGMLIGASPARSAGSESFSLRPEAVAEGADTAAAEPAPETGRYLLSSANIFGDAQVLYPGFLTGMRSKYSFQKGFADPLGNPLYFESPFIETNLRLLYLWHDFSRASQLAGGSVSVVAAQARVALTDRLAFIATKDGYSWLDTGITPEGSGWNDAALGLKYAFWIDEPAAWMMTGGMRLEIHNGDRDVLMGGDSGFNELSPFISFAKGWDRFHLLGDINWRAPMDRNDGNHIIQWDVHADYEIAPETLPGFFPFLEIHALHYLSDADYLPLSVGGLDYTNFGSSDVAGTSVFWGDLGFRWKLTPNMSVGAAYGFPISDPDDDIFSQRVTLDMILSF